MPKIDISAIPVKTGSIYPAPHNGAVRGRSSQRLADAGGLTQFGANLVQLAPGALSSLRHWHEQQDEFLMVTAGTLVLVEEDGETILNVGDCAAFPAGRSNGHHLINRSDTGAAFLVVGTRTETETAWYSDIDMKVDVAGGQMRFSRRDGSAMDGTLATADADIFGVIGAGLTKGLLDGDYAAYRSVFHLPVAVYPRNGDGYTVTTEAELREDYDLYLQAVREQQITGIRRDVHRLTFPEPDACVVEAEVHFFRDDRELVMPFVTTFRLERRGGDWRIARIISSLGHITWTRGEAGIGQDMKFELD